MRYVVGLLAAILGALAGLQPAQAEKRVALIVGNAGQTTATTISASVWRERYKLTFAFRFRKAGFRIQKAECRSPKEEICGLDATQQSESLFIPRGILCSLSTK